MVRKTFGRAGETLTIGDGEAGHDQRITIVEAIADDTGTIGEIGNTVEDGGNIDGAKSDAGSEDRGTIYAEPTAAEQPRRRGGRPRGTRNKAAGKASAENSPVIAATLEKVLLNLHLMGAALLKEPELQIDSDEAKLLAEAVAEVANAYDFTSILSPKAQALIDLSIACGTVYIGRVIRIAGKHKAHRPNVVPIQAASPATGA